MKRVLIFSLGYYPDLVSGAEVAIREITDRIPPSSIEFHMVTLWSDRTKVQNEKIGNVFVHRVGFGSSYFSKICYILLAGFAARALHKDLKFDAFWAVMTYMLFPVLIAKRFGVSIPHMLTLQDGDPYEKVFKRWFIRPLVPLLRTGFQTAKVVQAISSYLAMWPLKQGYEGPIEVIYNGFDPGDARPISHEKILALRRMLGKKDGDVWLVNTARLEHQKGNDVTIRALALLPAHVKLLLVGSGTEVDMLRHIAKETGAASRVIFVEQVDRTEVTAYRGIADIFVGPSRSEGLGIAFLSAMVSRLPVIATQEGGLAEFVFDKKKNPMHTPTAWAVQKDSPQQIADAVNDIISNPEKVKEVTENARSLMLEKYDWDTIAVSMQLLFERVCVGGKIEA